MVISYHRQPSFTDAGNFLITENRHKKEAFIDFYEEGEECL